MIRFDAATLGYRRRPVLSDVACEIGAGEFVGLVGPNGAGKTTFLRSILGLIAPLAGRLEVDRSRRFAYVPQVDDLNLLWPLTIRGIVSLAVKSRRTFGRLTAGESGAIEEALQRTGLDGLAKRRYDEVSGGQRQRAILAQALAQEPDVLLLDEPTSGLDVKAERDFIDLLRALNQERGLTILLVTHALGIPMNATSKILLFHDGSVVTATSDELAHTDRLDRIYGIPFVRAEAEGVRWVWPKGRS